MRSPIAVLVVLAACASRPRAAPSPPSDHDAAAATTDVAIADAGPPEDASPPPPPPFDLDTWLTAQGVKQWKPDATCWSKNPLDKTMQNACTCGDPLRLPKVELLQCVRAKGTASPVAPVAHHTILYVAEAGALRVVFDRATGIMPSDRGPIVMLRARVDEAAGEVVVEESREGGAMKSADCDALMPQLEADVREAAPMNRKLAIDMRDGYGEVCRSRGRYAWNGRTLVKKR